MYIAILSRGPQLYSTQSLFRAALRKGHRVRVFDHMHCDIVLERGKPTIYYLGEVIPHIDAVIPRIGSSVTFYGSSIVRQFEMMGVFSTLSSEALLRSRDKLRSMQLISNSDLGIPKTVFANNTSDAKYLTDIVGGPPLIIKLLEGTHGAGVVLARDQNTAESVIEAFSKTRQRFLVQEFIEEADGADVRAIVVDGKVVAAMKRRARPGDFRSNLHRGGSSIHVKLDSREEETALRATEILGLRVAGVDMLQSNKGPLLLEVNASPGLEGIETTTRIDIAGQIIDLIEKYVKVPEA